MTSAVPDSRARGFELQAQLQALDARQVDYASRFVQQLLAAAEQAGASDVHLQPQREGLFVRWRLDGVLHDIGRFPRGEAADIVARLKVLAELLTYRTEVPQDGRIREAGRHSEIRVSTFPTLHGERAVIRLFAGDQRYLFLEDLGLPPAVTEGLQRLTAETSGVLIISGPAGSGKTTTAYACLREIARRCQGGKSLVSIEDPIEVEVPGVAQGQVNEPAGLTLAGGLKALLRQDPEVILVGEIRDPSTAEQVFQASLTGHLLITTFHAGSAAEGLSRLADMAIEPYQLRSALSGIISQRLVRRLCQCAQLSSREEDLLGFSLEQARVPVGCSACLQTGYQGRVALAEMLVPGSTEISRGILAREDAETLEQRAVAAGMLPLAEVARQAVQQGLTSPAEVRRALGFRRRGT